MPKARQIDEERSDGTPNFFGGKANSSSGSISSFSDDAAFEDMGAF